MTPKKPSYHSTVLKSFRKQFQKLPKHVRKAALKAYRLWLQDPYHPSLEFKCVQPQANIYAVRIGLHWRALGVMSGDVIKWFWVGSHEDYDKLL